MMEKYIVFVMTPFISHLMPTYKLANGFRAKGYQVVYVSSLKFKQEIESNGFVFQNSALMDEDKVFMKVETLIPFVMSKYCPELCLVEVAFWNWALFLLGMKQKFMMIQTWPCCNKGAYILPEGYRIVQKRNLFTFLQNEWAWIMQNRKNKKDFKEGEISHYYQDLIKKTALDPKGTYISKKNRIGYFKVLNVTELILFPVEFDFPRKADAYTKFIGPFIDTARAEHQFDWSLVEGPADRIVFCSMGSLSSIFKKRDDFYERMIAAFTDRPDLVLIMSVGKGNIAFANRSLPGNIYLCEYAPQLDILKKAVLFITHGGAGSIKESIQFGVPMLVYPWQSRSDMFGNADRVVYHHLGAMGDIENDLPSDIISRVDEILASSTIRKNIEKMKTVAAAYEHKEEHMVDFILQN